MNKSVVFRENTEELVCFSFVINSHAHMTSFYSNIIVANSYNLSLCTELSFKIIVVMNARFTELYRTQTTRDGTVAFTTQFALLSHTYLDFYIVGFKT